MPAIDIETLELKLLIKANSSLIIPSPAINKLSDEKKMARSVFAVSLLVAVAIACVNTAAVPKKAARGERPGFIFLGSTKKEIAVTVNRVTSVTYEDYNYWISVNAAGYAEAARDCRANGDALLQIETAEELDVVEGFLQDTDQTVSLAWVGGKYQVSGKTFTWENGQPILSNLWAAGQPSQSKPNSRVAASLVGQIVQLRSQANTQTTRYICEGL